MALPAKAKRPTPRASSSFSLSATVLVAAFGLFATWALRTGALNAYLPRTVLRLVLPNNLVYVLNLHTLVDYKGTTTGSVEHFQNIFYAEDTSGKNRFAPPVPYVPERFSTVDATTAGAWCPQGTGNILPFTSVITNVSEDCLSLRIARPNGTRRFDRRPVAVFVHGGGHALGSASDILYTPDGLVQQSVSQGQPIIYVGINYRVGIFGFADSDALRKRKHTNVGLRDQLAAIKWVKQNIANFGGDARRITVIGQSVGASDIGLHLVSGANKFDDKFELPFQRAVLMNGGPGLVFSLDTPEVQERTSAVAEKLGCAGKDGAQSARVLQCLRDAPVKNLTEISVGMMRAARPPFGEGFFQPYVDGDYIAAKPSELLKSGDFATHVPIIAGWDHDDGAWYAQPTTNTDEDVKASLTTWLSKISPGTLNELLKLYPASDFEDLVKPESPVSSQYYRAARINRDLWFTCPVIDLTFNLAKHAGPQFAHVYETRSTRLGPALEMMGVPFWKVSHLSGLPYVFNAQNMKGGVDNSPEQLELSKHVSSQIIAWVNEIGSENGTGAEGSPLQSWAPAYTRHASDQWTKEFPAELDVNVWGGPFGSGMAFSSKKTARFDGRHKALVKQRLLQRCSYINSAEVKKELGI